MRRLSVALVLSISLLFGCVENPAFGEVKQQPATPIAHLNEPGWNPHVKARLEKLLDAKRGQGLPIVFDFDNTLVCRDIGEATFGIMIRDRMITKEGLPANTTPVDVPGDLVEVYDAYLEATSHHPLDKAPYLNAYAWLVQILAGLTPKQIVDATKIAYMDGAAQKDMRHPSSLTTITVTPDKTSYRVPYFYPEMVELISEAIKGGYEVWVISASNAWTVRWMVTQVLNPKLRERGTTKGIVPDHVIGITTLLQGPDGKLYKDPFLTLEKPEYANLNPDELAKYKLTSQIVEPMSSYFGKSANILQWIDKTPYLVAGDSPNDHGMLAMAQNKLWITRLESPAYQKRTAELAQKTNPESWMFQPTLIKASSGFVSTSTELSSRIDANNEVRESVRLLSDVSLLKEF